MTAVSYHNPLANVIVGNKTCDICNGDIVTHGAVMNMCIPDAVQQRQSASLAGYTGEQPQPHRSGEGDIAHPFCIEGFPYKHALPGTAPAARSFQAPYLTNA